MIWSKLSVKPVLTPEQVLNQLLWNNQFLRIGGKPWKLFSRGIISVANIMTNNGSLKPWSCFKADGLNFNNYFLLLGLFNSLPLTWKKLIKDEGPVHIASSHSRNTELKFTLYLKDDTLSLDSITSSKLYWKLVQTIQTYPSARHKYTTLFNDCNLDWEAI